ncbi:MAG: RecX family transcriptional regulator [Treponema sp.]|jgi:regulatory protein|nr:RecX family transcriptional regulator [Treponema sp.]
MTIISIKQGNDAELFRVEFSDASSCVFRASYLSDSLIASLASFNRNSLEVQPDSQEESSPPEISEDEEQAFHFAASCYRAEKQALALVARAEQCSTGLSRKLEKRGYGTAVVKAIVSRLLEQGVVDDRRYALRWLASRLARSPECPRKLLAALLNRGISREDAEKTLKETLPPEEEYRLLKNYLVKKRLSFSEFSAEPERNADPSLRYTLKAEGFSFRTLDRFREEEELNRD